MDKEKGTMIPYTNVRLKVIGWGLTVLAVLLSPSSSHAFTRTAYANGTLCEYWPNRSVSFSVNVDCSEDVNTTDCNAAVENSINAWNGHSCSDLVLSYNGTTPKTATGLDCFNLIVWRESSWKYDSSIIALTTTSYEIDTGMLYDADIEVNGVDYQFSTTGASGAMDIQNTLTHEMGHCIGLGHSTDPNAVMWATANEGENTKRVLSQDDVNGLCDIYPIGSGTPPCSAQQKIISDGVTTCPTGGGGCGTVTSDNNTMPWLTLVALLLFISRRYSNLHTS